MRRKTHVSWFRSHTRRAQGRFCVSIPLDPPAGVVEVPAARMSGFEDRTAGLGRDVFAVVTGKQPRQMMMALPSRAFSRSHHSGLVNRGSVVAPVGNGGRTAAWSSAL